MKVKEEVAFQRHIGHICCPLGDPALPRSYLTIRQKEIPISDGQALGLEPLSKYKLTGAPSSYELGRLDMNLGFIYHYKNKPAGEREEGLRGKRIEI